MPRGSKKKKNRYFTGKRTATKTKNVVETRNGRVYIERMDRSKYPKLTSVPCTEFVRRMLAVFKQAGGYPNYDELLFDLVTSQVEAHSLPKYILSGAFSHTQINHHIEVFGMGNKILDARALILCMFFRARG